MESTLYAVVGDGRTYVISERRYYSEHWQILRDLRTLGVIDPWPQHPRW